MTDPTAPMDLGMQPTSPGDFADTQPAPADTVPITFTGSGSEYFRIWIVNLLLTLLTLGIYYPWAKVRRLRYFHGNTLIGGDPLGYHADPKKMFKGYLLVSVLLLLYSVAGHFHAMAGLVAFVAVMVIWPALLKSSMQFRLANTSWRGLRFRFTGGLRGAYAALIPLFLPALCLVASAVFVPDRNLPPRWYLYVTGGVSVLLVVLFPWLFQRLKAYQHNHYALASQHTRFEATVGMFYKLFAKVLGLYPLVVVTLGIAAALVAIVVAALMRYADDLFLSDVSLSDLSEKPVWLMAGVLVAGLLVMIAIVALMKPYVTTRMQNLVWAHTRSEKVRILSTLKARSMLWLSVKNWFLVVFTLGLYWPFAAVARTRMQLEAVGIASEIGLDDLVNQGLATEGEAAGDAAGDLFGLDIGF